VGGGKSIAAVAGLAGLYHLIAHLLQRPLVGVSTALDFLGPPAFSFGVSDDATWKIIPLYRKSTSKEVR